MNNSKYELKRVKGAPVSSDEIMADIRHVAEKAGTRVVTQRLYSEYGNYNPTTVSRRFGSWNHAVVAAGLDAANELNYTNDRLFENLMLLWEHYGRQPRRAELADPPSMISQSPYNRTFGPWTKALEQFVAYANSQEMLPPQGANAAARVVRAGRNPSLRLRFRVLKRDNFACRACGRSPALQPGLPLHVDHVKAWSRGGETVEENPQTLCEQCNLGKSNVL